MLRNKIEDQNLVDWPDMLTSEFQDEIGLEFLKLLAESMDLKLINLVDVHVMEIKWLSFVQIISPNVFGIPKI